MYKSSILCSAGKDACWKPGRVKNPPNDQKRFGLEPHFMREILEWNIPIIIGGITYTPLCQEYPGSPGIDLVYLGSNSSIMLAEVKRDNTFDPAKLRRESFHHIYKHIQKDLYDLVRYCSERPEEAVQDAIPLLTQWFVRNP